MFKKFITYTRTKVVILYANVACSLSRHYLYVSLSTFTMRRVCMCVMGRRGVVEWISMCQCSGVVATSEDARAVKTRRADCADVHSGSDEAFDRDADDA